jgi:hypothetical protein
VVLDGGFKGFFRMVDRHYKSFGISYCRHQMLLLTNP